MISRLKFGMFGIQADKLDKNKCAELRGEMDRLKHNYIYSRVAFLDEAKPDMIVFSSTSDSPPRRDAWDDHFIDFAEGMGLNAEKIDKLSSIGPFMVTKCVAQPFNERGIALPTIVSNKR